MLERPRTAERYLRAVAAAVAATACLLLAANAGPAHSVPDPPVPDRPAVHDLPTP